MAHNKTEPDEINLDIGKIQEIAYVGLRRTASFLGFGLNAAYNTDLNSFEIPEDDGDKLPISLPFAIPRPEQLGELKEEFALWIIGNSFNELIETFSIFLDEVFYAVLLTEPDATLFKAQEGLRRFEGQNLTKKFETLSKIGISTEHVDCFETLNFVRNCLTHRAGWVGRGIKGCNDFNYEGNKLKVEWMGLDLYLKYPDGREIKWADQPHFLVPVKSRGN